ncbi:E3 SUMO-protein ligase ZBED1-like [Homalodisca vitripennis]|uniref:E3 SUMO-protein ligase ZBED1-like n=1 Tax=Homalodisca vitripennis TaxID=197043 RepID=UPI001EEAB75C|nr:E3 SUMO-protein ligase ZBED1-like [Homalodisca vitripennis]XP_046677685.1 E3 SUMO-protein ligase ZBED1-like [Homalodisca vitripennis]
MPVKKKSFVWQHFTKNNCGENKVTCNHCHQDLSFTLTTMSNLHRHLRNRHSNILKSEEALNVLTEQTVIEETSIVPALPGGFEITLEEMDRDVDESRVEEHDPDWTPETAGEWKPDHTSTLNHSDEKKEKKFVKRSEMWDHFQRLPCKTSAQCFHCGKVIKLGTTSNLRRHLRNRHPNIASSLGHFTGGEICSSIDQEELRSQAICTEVIEINIDDIKNPINIIESKSDGLDIVEEIQIPFNDLSETITNQASQTEFLDDSIDVDMQDCMKPKRRAVLAEHVDHQLVKMIVKGCHPISIVEEREFQHFVNLLHPKYQTPTVKRLTQELIPEYYEECEKKTCKSLQAAEGICLLIDEWKTKSNSYLCIAAHFINTECKFEAVFLACHILPAKEEASCVTEHLMKTVNSYWNIGEKVVAVVSDNSEIMSTAISLCSWQHVPHFVRTLSLVLYESLQSAKNLVNKIKNIIDELSKNPEIVAQIYLTHQQLRLPSVKLITKVKSDWNCSFSTLEMLMRFTKLQRAIYLTLQKHSMIRLTDNEWKVLKGLVEILEVFKSIKEEVKEGRVILSKVVFYIMVLKREMKKYQSVLNEACGVATMAEHSLNLHFRDLDQSDLVPNVLLLDPRLKKHAFEDESEFATACSHLKKEVCEVVLPEPQYHEPNPTSFWHSFDMEVKKINAVKDPIGKGILELENYLQEPLLGRDEDPYVWWNQRSAIYPRLFRLAKKYLCVTANSMVHESMSVSSAYMLSKLKNLESSPSESEIMFLHHNM